MATEKGANLGGARSRAARFRRDPGSGPFPPPHRLEGGRGDARRPALGTPKSDEEESRPKGRRLSRGQVVHLVLFLGLAGVFVASSAVLLDPSASAEARRKAGIVWPSFPGYCGGYLLGRSNRTRRPDPAK